MRQFVVVAVRTRCGFVAPPFGKSLSAALNIAGSSVDTEADVPSLLARPS